MSAKTILWTLAAFFAATVFLWFFFQNIILFASLHSPFPRHWTAVHLTSGEVFYGHTAGGASGAMKLSDVYFLETYKPAAAGSDSFSLADTAGGGEKFVLTKRVSPLYLNGDQVLYWEQVDPASEVGRYLR